jgi:hypothetical protein
MSDGGAGTGGLRQVSEVCKADSGTQSCNKCSAYRYAAFDLTYKYPVVKVVTEEKEHPGVGSKITGPDGAPSLPEHPRVK